MYEIIGENGDNGNGANTVSGADGKNYFEGWNVDENGNDANGENWYIWKLKCWWWRKYICV